MRSVSCKPIKIDAEHSCQLGSLEGRPACKSNGDVVQNERLSMVISTRPRLCEWKMTGFVEGF